MCLCSLAQTRPLTAAHSSQHSTQATTRKTSGSNKWTHFGARLRPLNQQQVAPAEAHPPAQHSPTGSTAASAPKSAFASTAGAQQQQLSPVAAGSKAGRASAGAPLASNAISNSNGDDDDDDDEVDGESLLYKMMQQQNFLLNPIWHQESGEQQQQIVRQDEDANSLLANDRNQPHGGGQKQGNLERDLASSKKVIRLLKSYSHIHQVDDSDDQIRGTQMRMSSLQRPQQVAR